MRILGEEKRGGGGEVKIGKREREGEREIEREDERPRERRGRGKRRKMSKKWGEKGRKRKEEIDRGTD